MALIGRVDEASCQHVSGWAWDPNAPETPAKLLISADGHELARVIAEGYREDLKNAGIGTGHHAFRTKLESQKIPYAAKSVRVQDAITLIDVEGSPFFFEYRLLGRLEEASSEAISGWAWNTETRNKPVELRILFNGLEITRVVANRFRSDLENANIGSGRHGFYIETRDLIIPITKTFVRVQEIATEEDLENSPLEIEQSFELNVSAKSSISALMESIGSVEDLQNRILFLAEQTNKLLQRISDKASNRRDRAKHRSINWKNAKENTTFIRNNIKRLLIIDNIVPCPARDAGSNVIFSHALAFQRIGYEVSFVSSDMISDMGVEYLIGAGIIVLCEPWTFTLEEVFRRQHGQYDVIYFHKIETASRYMKLARHYFPKAILIYCVADLHHVRLERQSIVEDRPELKTIINHLRYEEFYAAHYCNMCFTHSTYEASLIKSSVPNSKVFVIPWAVQISPILNAFSIRSGLGFVGNYKHTPNIDAALYLIEEIMPLVWKINQDIILYLVGSYMPAILSSNCDPRIISVGRVDDITNFLSKIRWTIAPLNYGAGIKGKVVDSFAAGAPCICSPIAAEGFDFNDPLKQLIVEGAAATAQKILSLYDDSNLFSLYQSAGVEYIKERFSADTLDSALCIVVK